MTTETELKTIAQEWLPSGWLTFQYPTVAASMRPRQLYRDSPASTAGEVTTALRRMISAIENHGWVQGSLLNIGGLCMQGAFFHRNGFGAAMRPDEHLSPLGVKVAALLAGVIKERGHELRLRLGPAGVLDDWVWVVDFNDSSGRTKDEVLAVMQEAAGITIREEAEAARAVPCEQPIPVIDFRIPDSMPEELDEMELLSIGT